MKKQKVDPSDAGQVYSMSPDELHRIKNAYGEESITLILTGKPISKECNLYAKRPILEEEKNSTPYEEKRLRRMLAQINEMVCPKLN